MNETPLTPRQSFAIFCATKVDVRSLNLTKDQASAFIEASKVNATQVASQLIEMGGVAKGAPKAKQDWQPIWNAAHKAGMEAVAKLQVVPMVVQQHASPLDDNSPVVKSYFVADGVCGFASVNVKPANSSFAKWLVANDIASKDSYAGGVCIWVHQFNQSLQRKETYAYAVSAALKASGINCYASSRMD